MPYHFEFDTRHRILLVFYEGEVHGWEIADASKELSPRFDNLKLSAVIGDFSAVTVADFEGSIVRWLSKKDVSFVGKTPFVIVVQRVHMFGLARMYELSADPSFPALRIVHNREEAFAALNLQNPKFEKVTLDELENL